LILGTEKLEEKVLISGEDVYPVDLSSVVRYEPSTCFNSFPDALTFVADIATIPHNRTVLPNIDKIRLLITFLIPL
jgi:hypothetical protein